MAGMTALSMVARRRAGMRRRRRNLPAAKYALLLPLFLYVPIMYGYPIVYNLLVSFEDFTMRSVVTGRADFVGLKNLVTVLRDPVTILAIKNTAIFTVTSLLLQYVIGMALALLFARRFPLNTFLRAVLLLPWLLPSIASVTAWLWLFDGLNGLINYLLMEAHILSRPVSWVELAQDGAERRRCRECLDRHPLQSCHFAQRNPNNPEGPLRSGGDRWRQRIAALPVYHAAEPCRGQCDTAYARADPHAQAVRHYLHPDAGWPR